MPAVSFLNPPLGIIEQRKESIAYRIDLPNTPVTTVKFKENGAVCVRVKSELLNRPLTDAKPMQVGGQMTLLSQDGAVTMSVNGMPLQVFSKSGLCQARAECGAAIVEISQLNADAFQALRRDQRAVRTLQARLAQRPGLEQPVGGLPRPTAETRPRLLPQKQGAIAENEAFIKANTAYVALLKGWFGFGPDTDGP